MMGAGLRRAADAAMRTRYPDTPVVAVGQRWLDQYDGAVAQREVVVTALSQRLTGSRKDTVIESAVCDVYVGGVNTKRSTTIAVARMVPRSGGYRYLGEGPPVAPSTAPTTRGLHPYRFADNPHERAFAEAWARTNVLGYVLAEGSAAGIRPVTPTDREQVVAATVVQWLGSPVGQGFLRDLGYVHTDDGVPQ